MANDSAPSLVIDYSDGLLLDYSNQFLELFSQETDVNQQSFELWEYIKDNEKEIFDIKGFGLIHYKQYKVALYLDKEKNRLLGTYK